MSESSLHFLESRVIMIIFVTHTSLSQKTKDVSNFVFEKKS